MIDIFYEDDSDLNALSENSINPLISNYLGLVGILSDMIEKVISNIS